MVRAEGYVGIIVLLDASTVGDKIKLDMSSSRILDHPKGFIVSIDDGNYGIKPKHTDDELNLSCSYMLYLTKYLSEQSDFLFTKIDRDFLIANAEQFL
jgi:hypothetical protein